MNIKMQIFLIIATIVCFLFLIKTVKKGKMRTDYAVGWIVASIVLIIVSAIPQLAFIVSTFIGIESPANAVFMFIIGILIILVFMLFNKVSLLEEKQKNLIQEVAMLMKKNDEGDK